MGKVDRVAHDVGLVVQCRRDVDGGVGDDERAWIGRCLHHEAVRDAPLGAQPGRARHDRGHQLVRMQAAFHQRVHLAAAGHRRGFLGGGVAVRHVDAFDAGEVDLRLRGGGLQLGARGNQHGPDDAGVTCVDGAGETEGVARVDHRHAHRLHRAHVRDQALDAAQRGLRRRGTLGPAGLAANHGRVPRAGDGRSLDADAAPACARGLSHGSGVDGAGALPPLPRRSPAWVTMSGLPGSPPATSTRALRADPAHAGRCSSGVRPAFRATAASGRCHDCRFAAGARSR